jgi:hypothetical protein
VRTKLGGGRPSGVVDESRAQVELIQAHALPRRALVECFARPTSSTSRSDSSASRGVRARGPGGVRERGFHWRAAAARGWAPRIRSGRCRCFALRRG